MNKLFNRNNYKQKTISIKISKNNILNKTKLLVL